MPIIAHLADCWVRAPQWRDKKQKTKYYTHSVYMIMKACEQESKIECCTKKKTPFWVCSDHCRGGLSTHSPRGPLGHLANTSIKEVSLGHLLCALWFETVVGIRFKPY